MSEHTTVTGTIKEVHTLESGTSVKGSWTKQSFLLTTKGQYPKDVLIIGFGKMTEQIKKLTPGSEITAFVNLESKEYNGKYLTNVILWKFEQVGTVSPDSPKIEAKPVTQTISTTTAEDDDLPF